MGHVDGPTGPRGRRSMLWVAALSVAIATLVGVGAYLGGKGEAPEAVARAPLPQRRGDVVFILLDTTRRDHLSIYGYREDVSPFISKFLGEAAIFEEAFSVSSWTAPSTASIFTGQYPIQHGVIEGLMAHGRREEGPGEAESINAIPSDVMTMSELFQASGYTTLGVSSNINIGPEIGFSRGFDHFVRRRHAPAEELLGELYDLALRAEPEKPRFYYIHLNDAHIPYQNREGAYEAADDSRRSMALAAYDAELRYADRALEQAFETFGWLEDTLVVLVTDHGEEFWDHGRRGHYDSIYPELTRIAWAVRAPHLGVQTGRVRGSVSGIDVLPTLWGLLEGPPQPHWTGRSHHALLKAPGRVTDPRPLLLHRVASKRQGGKEAPLWGVVDGDQLFIRWVEHRYLYDFIEDPAAEKNLVEALPEEVARLEGILTTLQEAWSREGGSQRSSFSMDAEMAEHLRALGYVE